MGRFEALDEARIIMDPRYTQVGFNLISVQVCCPFKKENFKSVLILAKDSDCTNKVLKYNCMQQHGVGVPECAYIG